MTKQYRKSEQRKRSKIVMVRMTDEGHAVMKDKAMRCGISLPQLLRQSAQGKRVRAAIDHKAINELRRLGGLQKLLFNEAIAKNNNLHSGGYAAILKEITATIARLGQSS